MLNLKTSVIIAILIALLLFLAVLAFLFTSLNKRVTKNYQIISLIIAGSLAVQIFISPFRLYAGIDVSSVVGFIFYLLTTQFFLKRYNQRFKSYQILGFVFVGIMMLQLPLRLDFKSTLISFPDFLLEVLGVFGGYCFYNRHRFFFKLNLSLSVLVVLFTFFYGYSLWAHSLDYGNFTGNVHIKGPSSITLLSKKSEQIKITRGKITVMDFWFVGCGQCMNEFPTFQKTYNAYKSNPKIQFYSVNKPYPSDLSVDRFKMLTDLGYNFPMAVCPDSSLVKSMHVIAYPTVVILNEDGDIIYKGNNFGATNKIKTLL